MPTGEGYANVGGVSCGQRTFATDPRSYGEVSRTVDLEPRRQSIREHLEELISSRSFRRSERLRCFLRFIVENWLENPGTTVKEYGIATEVYGRPPSFDPRFDPIVRVEARRLRAKLNEYYGAEGRNDALEISLPSGTYVPSIRVRPGRARMLGLSTEPAAAGIALEPFAVFGVGEREADFSRGLWEELLHALYVQGLQVYACGLRVIPGDLLSSDESRPSTALLSLEGSIRWCGNELRVSARLKCSADHAIIWSQTYTREVGDTLAVQESIAAAIALAIRRETDHREYSLGGGASRRCTPLTSDASEERAVLNVGRILPVADCGAPPVGNRDVLDPPMFRRV